MSSADAALWWARSRAEGPLQVPSATSTPAGMLRLVERGGERCWLLPRPPDNVTPAVLRELRMQALPVEHPNETSRVLAAALRCCWTDPQAGPWPGQPATVREVLDVVDQLMPGRGAEVLHRLGTGALRRLHASRWLDVDDEAQRVCLGPRWLPGRIRTFRRCGNCAGSCHPRGLTGSRTGERLVRRLAAAAR